MNKIVEQAKGILNDSAAKLKDLQGEGRKVAEKAKAEGSKLANRAKAEGQKVADKVKAKSEKVVGDVLHDHTVKDLLERFGSLKVPELVEKLKTTDLSKHTGSLRGEILGLLRVASAEEVENLRTQNERLAKELASLRTMKPQVTRIAEDVKTLKTAAKKKA